MKKIALINGKRIDPITREPVTLNILLANGKITGLGYLPEEDEAQAQILDIKGAYIFDNLIDSHAFFLDETKEGGDISAVKKFCLMGFSASIVENLSKPVDTVEALQVLKNRFKDSPDTLPHLLGAIDMNADGEVLTEFGLLKKAGVPAFVGDLVQMNPSVLKQALYFSSLLKCPLVFSFCRYKNNTFSFIDQQTERESLQFLLERLKLNGGIVHLSAVHRAETLAVCRKAKAAGLQLTCSTAAPYFTNQYPFEQPAVSVDSKPVLEGLKDGTIDMIATCTNNLTDESYYRACIPSIFHKLYMEEKIPISDILYKLSLNPQAIFNLPVSKFGLGKSPSFTVCDIRNKKLLYTFMNGALT